MSLDELRNEFKTCKKGDAKADEAAEESKQEQSKVADADLTNALAVLIKHDLVKAYDNNLEYAYSFDADQCLLRLSLPRFLSQLEKAFADQA